MLSVLQHIKVSDKWKREIDEMNEGASEFIQEYKITLKPSSIPSMPDIRNSKTHFKSEPKNRTKSKFREKSTTNLDTLEKNSIESGINSILEDSWYSVKSRHKREDTFYSSVLSIIDDNFVTYKMRERENSIKMLKQKMAVDLVEKNLYRLYGYNHNRAFKKSTLENELVENKLSSDISTRPYLSDYFDLNINCFEKLKSL